MSLASLIKRLQDIMRKDSGVDGDAQRLAQIVWLIFLKVYDYKEEEAELDDNYVPVIPKGYRWRDWAVGASDERMQPAYHYSFASELLCSVYFYRNELAVL